MNRSAWGMSETLRGHDIGDWADCLIERSLTPKQPPQSTRADVPVRERNND